MVRVLTGCLIQESNTFSPLRSNRSFFEAGCLSFDQASLEIMAGKQTELGGFIAAAQRKSISLIPTIAAWAASGGPFNGQDFAALAEEFLWRVRAAGPVDGVLLALHGAWVTEDDDDPDGWLLQQVRETVGPAVPIVVTLDLHANITTRMVAAADALVGFRTYPHIDMFATGERAAELLTSMMQRRLRPTMAFCKIPLLVPPENAQTTEGPMAGIMAEAIQLQEQPDCLSTSVFTVQPWMDVAELGCSIVVVTTGSLHIAQQQANALGEHLWRRRLDFSVPLSIPADAVAAALAHKEGPILLVDSADGVSSGAPGDRTAILSALLEARVDRQTLVTVVDPEAATIAARHSGEAITVTLGGKLDSARHRPVTVHGVVSRVTHSRVTFTAGVGDGLSSDLGHAAVLRVGDLRILLMENPVPCYDPALYRVAGLEPSDAHIIVVKSPNNFRWTYRDIARKWIYVDAPGASTPRLQNLSYTRAPRPIYPLDDLSWSAQSTPARDDGPTPTGA